MKNSLPSNQLHQLKGNALSGFLLSSGILILVAGWLLGSPGRYHEPTPSSNIESTAAIMGQSEVFLVVNWPEFATENSVELRNSTGTVLATVTSSGVSPFNSTVSLGCQDDGAGYTLVLFDSFGDEWNGFNPFVRVEDINNNILLNNVTVGAGLSPVTTSSFSVSGGGAACATCTDGIQNGSETGVDCGGPDCTACVNPNEICVNVFNDYNSNGTKDGAGELGIEGITVTAYNAANTASPFTYTSDGNYTFTPGNNDTYRVEVTGIPTDLEPTVAGATTVFFINRGNKVEVGLHRPAEYLTDDLYVSVPCYVDGPSNGPNAAGDVLVIVAADEATAGVGNLTPTEFFVADHQEIGATFGVAYSRAAESVFAAAFTKRHTAFGPGGTGAIYRIPLTSTTAPIAGGTPSVFIDLNTIFGANTAGVNPHPNTADFDRDPLAYDAVGKVGLGGLALSEDENVMWTINLADRRLYEMPLGGTPENPTAPAAGDISRWPATGDLTDLPGLPGNPAQRAENIRPFAVKCYRGAIYIGLVATGESSVSINPGQGRVTNTGDQSLLQGFIYRFDPATDVFTQVLSFPFDYTRGQAIDFCTNNADGEFFPWTSIYDKTTFETAVNGTSANSAGADLVVGTIDDFAPERAYPQPWITDIEFTESGNLLVGVRDRFADQHGFKKLPPTSLTDDPDLPFNADGAGDVLLASPNTTDGGATYVLENSSSNGTNGEAFGPTLGATAMEGPGTGEFFFDDRYRPADATADGPFADPQPPNCPNGDTDRDPVLNPALQQGHDEVSLGGLFQQNGSLNLLFSAYDPILRFDNFNQAGFISISTDDGSRQGAALVYTSQDFDNGTPDNQNTFGKGNGLGDMEGISPPAPLQVGNRLWLDANTNGRQDADEDGINGILVELFKETVPLVFTKVAETTTAADPIQGNGFFIFSDDADTDQTWVGGFTEVEPEMNYEVRVSLLAVQAVLGPAATFTLLNANGDATNDSKTDLNDSDASPLGVIAFTSGTVGQNNHTLDMGITTTAVCAVTVNSATPSGCDPNTNTYSLSVSVTYAEAPGGEDITITTNNGASQTFTPAGVAGTQTFVVTNLTADGVADIDVTATFSTTTTCTDELVDAYTAPDDCTPCSITVNSATPGACVPATNTYSLDVSVTYANAPMGEDITITTDNGASQTFTPASQAGTQTFTLTNLTSDGVADIDVTATYATTTTCTDTNADAYTAPANCTPCSITVNSATASVCDPNTNTYSLTVNVTYADAPAGEMINVTTDNGGSMGFSPAGTDGTENLVLTGLTSDGVADIDVTATYAITTGCTDTNTDAYTAPANCTPCSITVNSATASVCDPNTNTYSLTVNVTYANAPAGEMINVTTDNGGSMGFSPAGTDGTEDFVFTGLTSDGVADIDVTATYATTTTCTDTNTDAYTAPDDCTPCSITVNSATASVCDPNTNTYSLTVNVTYADAPAGEMINVTTDNGGTMSFSPAGTDGTEDFVVTSLTADGVADIDVTATYATTTTCTDTNTDAYTAPADCTPSCDVTITNVNVQCTNGTDFTVSFDVEWDYLFATADMIEVTIDGDAQTFVPVGMMGTQSFNNVPLTGPAYDILLEAGFQTNMDCATATAIDLIACTDPCVDALGGNVFNDFDNDGADAGAGEVGQANVLVEVYECDNPVPVATTYTNANGEWSVDDAGITYPVRVEFSTPLQDYLQPSAAGDDNGSNTQFIPAQSCEVDYGVITPNEYCDENPLIIVPCYFSGPQNNNRPALVGVYYDTPESETPPEFGLVDDNEIGTTYGVAYQPKEEILYVSAMVRHFFDYGPGGFDAIYLVDFVDLNGAAAPNPSGTIRATIDLSALGVNMGTDPRMTPLSGSAPYNDGDVYQSVGKVGIGDIDISDDGETLYVINLNAAAPSLVTLDISDPDNVTLVSEVAIPDPGCTNGDFAPWGTKYHEGKLYVGGVCTAETSGNPDDLSATVFTFDAASGFQQVLSLPLNYERAAATYRSDNTFSNADWQAWTNTWNPDQLPLGGGDLVSQPMPILQDIEFAEDGSIILGLGDRFSYQTAFGNRQPGLTTGPTYTPVAAGDILRVCKIDGVFVPEGQGSCTQNITDAGSSNIPAIPNVSEYYDDNYINEFNNQAGHSETALGGLTVVPGQSEILMVSFDPIEDQGPVNTSGIHFLNDDGTSGKGWVIVAQNDPAANRKGGSLGDAEALCGPLPIQIGNYVWIDADEDGVQDPCEESLESLPVSLYTKDDNGVLTLVATTVTNEDGEYYFTGDGTTGETWTNPGESILNDTTYLIVFGNTPESDTSFVFDNTEYGVTVDSTGEGTNPGLNDSDATFQTSPLGNLPSICYSTADSTDHTLDVGLRQLAVFDLALVKRLDLGANPGPFGPDSTVTFSVTVYNQGDTDATDIEVKDYVPNGLSLAPASAPDWTISVDTAILTTPFSLAAGMDSTLTISFIIDNDFMGDTLTNRAEISSFDDDNDPMTDPPADEDSTPNDNGADDPEVDTPDEFDDDGDGTPGVEDDPNDEDDYDFEGIPVVQTFDLSLIKTLDTGATPGPFSLGSTVTFAIRVSNQGSLDATEVEVSDYVPDGLTLVPSADWMLEMDTARLEVPFDLAAGADTTLSISFTIDNDFMGTRINNVAEISDAVNALDLPDEDSRPGDNGGDDPELNTDDEEDDDGLNGNGSPDDPMDSDDFDFAPLDIQRFSIGSTVFEDEANNGIQDGSDAGIPMVEVQLYAVVGEKDDAMNGETDDVLLDVGSDGDLATTTDGLPYETDGQGNYYFSSLMPGDYYVVIPADEFGVGEPLEVINVSSTDIDSSPLDNQTDGDDNGLQPDGPATVICSPVINLSFGEEPIDMGARPEDAQGNLQDNAQDANGDMTVDMGLFAPVSVGDTTFVDLDMDGTQSAGDEALPGVEVTLYDSGTMMPVGGNDVNGDPIVPLTTDPMGAYLFDNLPPGDYYVVFDLTNIDNADLYDFTTPNVGDDADDSDATPSAPTDLMAPSGPTGPLASGESDLTLDAGIACAIQVAVADPFTICATGFVDLLAGASVTPARLGAVWSTPDGTGTFVDAAGSPLTVPYELGTAARYLPSAADAVRGFVTLILTSNDPGDLNPASSCDPVSSPPLRIDILNVDCGQFLWDGEND